MKFKTKKKLELSDERNCIVNTKYFNVKHSFHIDLPH